MAQVTQKSRSRLIWLVLMLVSCLWGLGLSAVASWAQSAPNLVPSAIPQENLMDRLTPVLEMGQSRYLARCGTCHLAVPPAVLPSQTWDHLISDSAHYGATLPPIFEPDLSQIRRYLIFSSRPLNPDEPTPYRLRQSRYFKVLHPQVEFAAPTTLTSCIGCHPQANRFNFRQSMEPQSLDIQNIEPPLSRTAPAIEGHAV
ncbi:cytochrome C [Lyngbya confervoides]|uniref:Diheme cytochrome c n=1 Tax=Lyngbya confervoides BDU141951 TaxID=1574623 RepID=A0ABD4TBA6_9CYAN|nr:cytochrome C [Lyngbya confervoides]MCM1985295.1 diheme cytochrome c [Lyngbya confervoides BDU141951]